MENFEFISIKPAIGLGIYNLRYRMGNYEFDAALDFSRCLHAYLPEEKELFPIELYNCSEDWDVRVFFLEMSNDEVFSNLCLKEDSNFDSNPVIEAIVKETQSWMDEDPSPVYFLSEDDFLPDEEEDGIYPLTEADRAEEADMMDDISKYLPGEPPLSKLPALSELCEDEYEDVDPAPTPDEPSYPAKDDFLEYADRYGYAALGYALYQMISNGSFVVTNSDANELWEYGGNIKTE